MCACTPEMRTPFCGKPGCEWPEDPKVQKRKAFLDQLITKASTAVLSRTEALAVLNGTLVEMLAGSISQLIGEVAQMPEGFEKINALTFIEMAKATADKATAALDAEMVQHAKIILVELQ